MGWHGRRVHHWPAYLLDELLNPCRRNEHQSPGGHISHGTIHVQTALRQVDERSSTRRERAALVQKLELSLKDVVALIIPVVYVRRRPELRG
jgi:hypothetical protein